MTKIFACTNITVRYPSSSTYYTRSELSSDPATGLEQFKNHLLYHGSITITLWDTTTWDTTWDTTCIGVIMFKLEPEKPLVHDHVHSISYDPTEFFLHIILLLTTNW